MEVPMLDQMRSRDAPTLRALAFGSVENPLRVDGLGSPVLEIGDACAASTLISNLQPNLLIAAKGALEPQIERQFRAANAGAWSHILTTEPDAIAGAEGAGEVSAAALQSIERDFAKNASFAGEARLIAEQRTAGATKSVCVVGAGITGLMTALRLSEQGFEVVVLEGSPAPRVAPWTNYGCTHGGADARMYSATEYDNYNEKRDRLYVDMANVFERPLSRGGWLAMDPCALSRDELVWNEMFRRVPVWLAQGYSAEIFEICRQGGMAWSKFFADHSAFRAHSGMRDGVVRTYDDPSKLEAARKLQTELGALQRILSPAEAARRYPLFSDAVANGAICGALEVSGFTVQIHAFMQQLVRALEDRGVRIEWSCRADRLIRDSDDRVLGVEAGSGIRKADHYVLSPGAYGGDLATGFVGGSLLHGVIGAWLVLPHVGGELHRSAKLKRAAELNQDVNVTIGTAADGTPTLTLGSGYGYIGGTPSQLDQTQLELMYRQLDEIAAQFFPKAHAAALAEGTTGNKQYCVRPWTPSGLGVFECQRAETGVAILIGGHTTGGFAIAPLVAASVVAALTGQAMDLHWQFQSRRLAAALPALHHLVS
jgi:glycine/D-amino acid oxidase-like deaminating enzyme